MSKINSEGKKTGLNHILIIKNLYYEFDGRRINAEQAQIYLETYKILRKQPIVGGICYELGE